MLKDYLKTYAHACQLQSKDHYLKALDDNEVASLYIILEHSTHYHAFRSLMQDVMVHRYIAHFLDKDLMQLSLDRLEMALDYSLKIEYHKRVLH